MPLPYDKENWRDEPAPDIDSVLKYITQDWGYENRRDEKEYQKRFNACFEFPNGFLSAVVTVAEAAEKMGATSARLFAHD